MQISTRGLTGEMSNEEVAKRGSKGNSGFLSQDAFNSVDSFRSHVWGCLLVGNTEWSVALGWAGHGHLNPMTKIR